MTRNEAPPSAFIKHQLPGRVRLKMPQKRGDFGYFDRLGESFSDCPGITQLQLNPPAASILICHAAQTDFIEIAEFAQTNGLFTIIEQPLEEVFSIPNLPLATLTSKGLNQLDESLLDFSRKRLDGRSLLFLALLGLAGHQMTQGRILGPATSFLWYALSLLREARKETIKSVSDADSDV